MLIEFSVSNFRSFREKQTFSMVAAPRLRKKENVISPVVKGEKVPDLLKVAAVYGPNAAGKSNLVKALGVFQMIASREPSTGKQALPVAPFRFDPALIDEPCRFEWHFISEEMRYCFELAANVDRIIEERLTEFPGGKEKVLYERKYAQGGYQYTFDSGLEGGEALHQLWQDMTNSQTLLIRQAVVTSKDELRQLRIPFNWLMAGLMLGANKMSEIAKSTLFGIEKYPTQAKKMAVFLQTIDVPVTDVEFEFPEWSDELPQDVVNQLPKAAKFTHETALGTARFNLSDESDGTRNLIGFWSYWTLFSEETGIASSHLLVVDELDSSLHPEIVATLVRQRLQQAHHRQLIFTTHDTHLMDAKILRRDQFWLTERDMNGATQLYSIHDIEGRESEDIEKRYYEGRYRGLPILRNR